MAEAEKKQAAKGKKRMGRPVSNAEPKERMTFWMDSQLCFKVRALAFEAKRPYSAVFNDMVREAPEPIIDPDKRPKAGAQKYSRVDESGIDKERITFWMEPALAQKVRTMAFIATVPHSKIGTDLVRAAPTPKMSGG